MASKLDTTRMLLDLVLATKLEAFDISPSGLVASTPSGELQPVTVPSRMQSLYIACPEDTTDHRWPGSSGRMWTDVDAEPPCQLPGTSAVGGGFPRSALKRLRSKPFIGYATAKLPTVPGAVAARACSG